ncbi:hypothetical protein [Clostridium baratii]|uniref:hypothetical protein n=1 Tax=Clostridium baratii TaxID=1561 RepID=UPI001C23FF91|nr:hypothetical protein [Clostridium baratii]
MLYILTIIGGVIFLVLAFLVGVNKNISLISVMTEAKLKQIKKKDRVAIDFGAHYFFISLACFLTSGLTALFGRMGMYIGLVLVVVSAFAYSSLSSSVDDKIRRNKY